MKEHENMIALTEKMIEYLAETDKIYEKTRETGEESDFFTVIKPFVNEVLDFAEVWCQDAIEWVETYKPRNVYPIQIDAAKENLKEICVQAFFPKTSYKRFKHHINSIHYTLEKLLTEVKKYQE